MPTVLRVHGLRFMIFVDDHLPPHVHVFGDGEAKIEIGGDGQPPIMIYSVEMSVRLQRQAMAAVFAEPDALDATMDRNPWSR